MKQKAPIIRKNTKPRPTKYEKPLKLNMPFDEAVSRIVRVPPLKNKK